MELSAKTKIFCGCSTVFGAPVNTNVCPVCLAMPGALPVLNKKVVEYAIALGLALNCNISEKTIFDRKNYFYPDNPQNYQISQLYSPIGKNGHIEINCAENLQKTKKIRIHELHMEEDAGKLVHKADSNDTLIDFNRAGVPLIEIVTEPDMRNAGEVLTFLKKLRTTIQYLGISDCRMNEGSMRVDVNLSVRPVKDEAQNDKAYGGTQNAKQKQPYSSYEGDDFGAFGTRTEMKNLNSFRSIALAIESESERQISLIESGNRIEQETRRWDDDKKCSFTMRSKEDAMDYRYFPDPDLPPLIISQELIERIRAQKPEFREEKVIRYMREYSLSQDDAEAVTEYKSFADIFEKTVSFGADPKKCANRLMGDTIRLLKEKEVPPEELKLDAKSLAELIKITDAGTVNSTVSKELFEKVFDAGGDSFDVGDYIEKNGLAQMSDTGELEKLVKAVVDANPQSVDDYRAGKKKAIGFLVGQMMKQTQGKADPTLARQLIEKEIGN